MKFFILVVLSFFFSNLSFAQNTDYAAADAHAAKLGPLSTLNVATIADTITRPFNDKAQKARAIYYWITHNISLDLKATKANDNRNIDPVIVISSRKANPLGFATLFQEMSSMANIRCLTVDGYIKRNYTDIKNVPDEVNHSWVVVQLGKTPTEWYYIDPASGAGYSDEAMKTFTPSFTSEYFFAEKSLFDFTHFPDNMAWQLGGPKAPKTKKDFYVFPVIHNNAFTLGLRNIKPVTGFLKAKTKVPVAFSFNTSSDSTIAAITLISGDERHFSVPVPMNFTNTGGLISFTYQFKKEDSFPLRILVDGKVVVEYLMEINE